MTPARSSTSTGASQRVRNRRGEGARLRADIVSAATRLLQQRGAEDAVTLRAVAREAGIAAPSIYAHFPDAEAIIGAVVAETFDALTAALRASREGIDDPVRRLTAQCDAYVRFAGERPGLYRVLFSRSRPGSAEGQELPLGADAERATAMKNATIVAAGTPAFDILVEAIVACVAAGTSASSDPFLDAIGLWSALHGYIGLRAAASEFPWPDDAAIVEAMIAGQARLGE